MTFDLEINGRRRRVTVQPLDASVASGGRFRVLLEAPASGEEAALLAEGAVEVDVRHTGTGLSILYVDDQRSVDVVTAEVARGRWLLGLPQGTLTAVVNGRRLAGSREAAGSGVQRVTSPMPGRVVRVLVKTGDVVAARQGLVVVEAMKMENELSVPRGGRVREVLASEGAPVEAGRLLVVVE